MKPHVASLWKHLLLILLIMLSLFPIYFMLTNSLKNPLQYAENQWLPAGAAEWKNYVAAWRVVAPSIINSIVIVSVSTFCILLLSSLCAYAIAAMSFPGKRLVFASVFVLLLVPSFVTLIPLYLQIKRLGLPSYSAVILPYVAGGQALSVFVLKTFFEGVPRELIEAARIDGASDFHIFRRIMLPLSYPVLASIGIINFVPLWNDYLLPHLLLDRRHQTITVALVAFQGNAQSHTAPNFGALMASYVLSAIPLAVLLSLLMRRYVEGLTSGAVKM